jgi:hypothetical protein
MMHVASHYHVNVNEPCGFASADCGPTIFQEFEVLIVRINRSNNTWFYFMGNFDEQNSKYNLQEENSDGNLIKSLFADI